MTTRNPADYRPAVGIMLINADAQVWVGQRLDSRYEAWQMPQGGIDDGEDVERAALRELGEETGISASLVKIIAHTDHELYYDLPPELKTQLWKGRYLGQRQTWFLMRFLGSDADVNIETHYPEFGAWKWVAPAVLPDIIVPFKRALYEEAVAYFAPYF